MENCINISDLDVPDNVKDFYIGSGIETLYPPQSEVIRKGLLQDKNVLAAIPTACGKTLLAELAMLKSVLSGGKAIYIVPLIALANEKYDRFCLFEQFGVKTGISTGEFGSKSIKLGENDIIVCTSEKADSLMRNGAPWMDEITCIVVDEVHLLNDSSRGPVLDVTMTKLRHLNPNAQMLALSATVGNADEVAEWLDAELVVSEWRPTTLYEGIFCDGTIQFGDKKTTIKPLTKDPATNIVLDVLKQDSQCLIFNSSRRNSSAFAKKVGKSIKKILSPDDKRILQNLADRVLESSNTNESKKLAECIQNGASFHHAGLNSKQRKVVEEGFKENHIKIISCTPTLAAGLNLPARRVLVRQYTRYHPDFGSVPIPVLEYKQMAGRAGRPHLDPYGEAILLAKDIDEIDELLETYILADTENIESKLGIETALRTHVLSCIASGYTSTREQMLKFMSQTFCAYHMELDFLLEQVETCIDFLKQYHMITETDSLESTKLGNLISRLYVDPLSAANIIDGLTDFEQPVTDMTLLHIASHTPDVRNVFFTKNDYFYLNEYIENNKDVFTFDFENATEGDISEFLPEVKTSLIMLDWVNGDHPDQITGKYNVYEGDIHNIANSTEWIMYAISKIAGMLDLPGSTEAILLEKQLKYGVPEELLPLVTIKNIGRVRARKLYNAGYTTKNAIKNIDHTLLKKIVGNKIADKILYDLGIINEIEQNDPQDIDAGTIGQTSLARF